MSYTVKEKSQQFIRRKFNLIRKIDQLIQLCHADFALIICKNNKYYIYWLINQDQWSLTITEIVDTDLIDIDLINTSVLFWLKYRINHTLCQLICYLKTALIWFMKDHKSQRRKSQRIFLNCQSESLRRIHSC